MRIAITGYAHPFGEGTTYGAERVIWYLIQELKKLGHECVVFSVAGTNVPGFEFVQIPKPWDNSRDLYWEAIKARMPFDMIHSYQASGFISPEMRNQPYCLEPFFGFYHFKENIIAYSKLMNKVDGNNGTVIYFGIPEEPYASFEEKADDYLVWIGRMDHGKAPDLAIEVAKRAGKRLILMGPSYHYPYFYERVWPKIDNNQIIWLRGVDDEIKRKIFRKAKAFLSTNWDNYGEMFGIVNIESLAAGCPVIGWSHADQRSAMNFQGGEIIEHGKHGFINEYKNYTPEEREACISRAVEYINQIDSISRAECHSLFLKKFTAKIMTDKHLKYYNIVRQRGKVLNVTGEI